MTFAGQAVVCEEIFDDSSHPSAAEIRDYASKLGVDPNSEPQLLPLAAEGLMKPLPPGWKPCYDDKRKAYYYHNATTGKTQWEHPLDEVYRGLISKARTESQSLSLGEPTEDATYNRDDLPSFEEPVPQQLQLSIRKKDIKLSPLKMIPKLGDLNTGLNLDDNSSLGDGILNFSDVSPKREIKLSKQKSEERPASAFGRKISLNLFKSFDEDKDFKASRVSGSSELTLAGGGSMFLKSNTKKQLENGLSPVQTKFSNSFNEAANPLRSILRENSKNGEMEKYSEVDNKEDDDRKIVRFKLDKNSAINIENGVQSEPQNDSPVIADVKIQRRFSLTKSSNEPEGKPPLPIKPAETERLASSLKLIKPDPADFLKPALKIKTADVPKYGKNSDSEDESPVKHFESESSNDNVLIKFDSDSVSTSPEDLDVENPKTNNILTKAYSNDIFAQPAEKSYMEIQKELKVRTSNEIENIKKSISEQKEQELKRYHDESFKQHKLELEKVLITEKTKHEDNIKQELENLRKEMEIRATGALNEEKEKLESQLEEQKSALNERFKTEEEKWERILLEKFEKKKKDIDKLYDERLTLMEKDLKDKMEQRQDELVVSHNAILDQIKQNHAAIILELQKDYKTEEETIRKEHQKLIIELRNKVAKEANTEKNRTKDVEEERMYEKVRCEKRLLEDKYRCLKDKYLKLKTEIKLSIEKRNRKREQSLTTTTGSETERSPSLRKDRTPTHSPSSNRKNSPKHLKLNHSDLNRHKSKFDHQTRHIIIQDMDTSASDRSYKTDEKYQKNELTKDYDSSDIEINPGRNRRKLFTRAKSCSSSRTNNNVRAKDFQRSCSPVENLRKQLQKLEDLEDQFPQNTQGDTYHLRHRIHLERDSIRRAKESLKKQKSHFKQRQSELKLKHGPSARNTLQQLCQEEKELTDMEVSLHRTRSLLGEKVIRLRHLEQSLQRANTSNEPQHKQEDATLSDLSSHSASSGISSTEFAMCDPQGLRGSHFKESSEIIQSLENLNSEIREIWEVLNKQHQASNIATLIPPLPLIYPDLGWPILAGTAPVPPSIPTLADRLQNYRQHIALANAQSTMVTHDTQGATTTLVEKTRNLRQWLRQTSLDPSVDNTAPQATL